MRDREDSIGYYRRSREEKSPDDRNRWVLLIKELRLTHDCAIYEAERLALLQPSWRRWVEQQINRDPACAKTARYHIKHNGAQALLAEQGGKLIVR